MEKINLIWEIDKKTVFDYLYKNCLGSWNAKFKKLILPEIVFVNEAAFTYITKERYFRRIISELKKEGHVYSSNKCGYWFGVLYTQDQEEINMMKLALIEDKHRALNILGGIDRKLNKLEALQRDINQNQQQFFNANYEALV